MFRFVIGKAKQGSDVCGGFFPNPMCLFIFTATEWSRMSAEPPLLAVLLLSRASPQCWQQQGKFPGRTELHLVHEPYCGPKLLQCLHWAYKNSFSQICQDSNRKCGANKLACAMEDKISVHLLLRLQFLLFQGEPCRLQLPAPFHTALPS